ncbi:hypothetical protein [Gorillibacterium sp. sgz5001074]
MGTIRRTVLIAMMLEKGYESLPWRNNGIKSHQSATFGREGVSP